MRISTTPSPGYIAADLARLRKTADESDDPEQWLVLAWTEHYQGHAGRARDAARRARTLARRAVEPSPRVAIGLYLLEELLRLRGPEAEPLTDLVRRARSAGDPEAALLGLGNFVVALGREGHSNSARARLFERMATAARLVDSGLAPELQVRAARAWLEGGELRRARTLSREVLELPPRRRAADGMARVLERVCSALLGERPSLEGLPLRGLPPPAESLARLLLANTLLRLGMRTRAREALQVIRRRLPLHRYPDAEAGERLVRAQLALLEGSLAEAEGLLATRPAPGLGRPLGWRHEVLAARLALARGDQTTVRQRVTRLRPALEHREDAELLGEVDLLRVRLDLRARALDAGGLVRTWEELPWSEEGTDRVRAALLLAPHAQARRLRRRVIEELPARHADPRARTAAEVLLAVEEARRGARRAARRRLNRLEVPPRIDVPEGTLDRWLALMTLEASPARPELLAADPDARRGDLWVCRQIHGRPPRRLELVTPKRRASLDLWDLARVLPRRERVALWIDVGREAVYTRGRALDFSRHPRTLQLLATLAAAPGRWISIGALVEEVWERRPIAYETDTLVHTNISRLRRRLPERSWIQTRDGHYRLDPRVDWILLRPPSRTEGDSPKA